jgi:hypothetical protein
MLRVSPFRAVYLHRAGNADEPVRSHPRGVNQPVLSTPIRVLEPDDARLAYRRAHLARSAYRCSSSSVAYMACGCGRGGTRNSSTSLSVQTWSVNPAAIAGVHGRHCLAEPVPLVGTGCGNGWRRLMWGKQKL